MPTDAIYDTRYFSDAIFETDYDIVANSIVETYHPKSVIDVGCGPGRLSAALDRLGVSVTAVDGYSEPEFGGNAVEFGRVDLNDPAALLQFIGGRRFDVAICVEVAEHLDPAVSSALVSGLVAAAPIVVFSSGVPLQGGHGHINLRPRDFWHAEFSRNGCLCADRIRPLLRTKPDVAPWYRLNVVDYVHSGHPQAPVQDEVITRLIAAESYSTSEFFRVSDELGQATNRLRQFPVNWALACRLLLKRLLGR